TFTWKQIYLPAQAYTLDQQYKFSYAGSYYLNNNGVNEKWLLGANNAWFWIMPNGDVRRYTGNNASTLSDANLLGTLDASYYNDPSKLWNAPYAGMPPVVFSLSGNVLSIRSPAPWYGTYSVAVTATDGSYTLKQTFNVNEVAAAPTNSPPVLT